jgi:dTDP-4-dehydrorhamnose reductase
MLNVLITGADGQLGSEFLGLASGYEMLHLIPANRSVLDITNTSSLVDFIKDHDVDVVINCAAYTNVEKAEDEPELAHTVNGTGPMLLGRIAKDLGVKVLHISTDYVFDGKASTPIEEGESTNPLSVYGASKLKGEEELLNENVTAMVFRVSWLYSTFGNNFYLTMRKLGSERSELKVVNDQVATPTYARVLARDLLDLISSKEQPNDLPGGLYHYSHDGQASWFDFASKIFDLSETDCLVEPVDSSEFPTKAERPKYSKLSNSKIKTVLGISPISWEMALEECVKASDYEHV